MGAASCGSCGRPVRGRAAERQGGPVACSLACAERLLAATVPAAIVGTLARPVAWRPDGKEHAWLCLEPLPEDELARRRGLLRHGTEATG